MKDLKGGAATAASQGSENFSAEKYRRPSPQSEKCLQTRSSLGNAPRHYYLLNKIGRTMPGTMGPNKDAAPLSESEIESLNKRTNDELASHSQSRHVANMLIQALVLNHLPAGLVTMISRKINDNETESGGAE